MTTPESTQTPAFAVPPGAGRHLWHIDSLMTFKALAEDTGGRLAVWEESLPQGSSPPLHVHHHDDEAWFVLDGGVTFQVDDVTWQAEAGTFIWGPHGRAHTFRVDSPTARLLGLALPAGFDHFVLATGRPAEAPVIPPPPDGPPDMPRLVEAARAHGIEVLGPPLP
jgi:quercetin dioxygenase-like cupin family protein